MTPIHVMLLSTCSTALVVVGEEVSHAAVSLLQVHAELVGDEPAVGSKPWAGVKDPVNGGHIIVASYVNDKYVSMLPNFMRHMKSVLPQVPYYIFTLDNETHETCLSMRPKFPQCRCKYRPISAYESKYHHENDDSKRYESPVYQYKTDLFVSLVREKGSALFLDIAALVLSEKCWDEFLGYPEDVVGSPDSHLNDEKSQPPWFAKKYGMNMNTGAILFRNSSLPVLESFVKLHLKHGGSDQTWLAETFDRNGFKWTRAEGAAKLALTNMTLRFLPYPAWGRNGETCLYHPHDQRQPPKERFREDGYWYPKMKNEKDDSFVQRLRHWIGR